MYTFSKEERLCNKKLISGLYHNGSSFLLYPLRVQWQVLASDDNAVKVLFSVPKRAFKKAVNRNLLKRRMREAYRLQRLPFFSHVFFNGKLVMIAFHYIAKNELPYALIEKKMLATLTKLLSEMKPQNDEVAG